MGIKRHVSNGQNNEMSLIIAIISNMEFHMKLTCT